MSFSVIGLGTAVPESVLPQADSLRITQRVCGRSRGQADRHQALHQQVGISTRHMAFPPQVLNDLRDGTSHSGSVFLPTGPDDCRGPSTGQRMAHYAQQAPPLAVRAARLAVDESGLQPGDFTHLITISCTGFHAPGVDVTLIQDLGLSPSVERTHVGFMGCHGAINGLRVGRAFTGADPRARVLLCAVELCGIHFHYGDEAEKQVANALFADGAAAAVGVTRESAPPDAWSVAAAGSRLLPDSTGAMSWTVGDHGFEMTLSRKLPWLIARHLRPWLADWLGGHGLTVEAVPTWAVHPGGPKILDAVEESLGLSRASTAVSRDVFARHGNMSSPTVLFILDRLRREQATRPCVALGFGPGVVAEAVLVR